MEKKENNNYNTEEALGPDYGVKVWDIDKDKNEGIIMRILLISHECIT